MTTTLITGATRGLGLEAATQLTAAGHTVYLGARDLARGQEVAAAIGARPVQLDVTDDASVAAAAELVRRETGVLDVLVNNAGIARTTPSPGDVPAALFEEVFDTNVFGVVRVLQAFLALLRASTDPLVVNVSSGLGSLRLTTEAQSLAAAHLVPAYNSSKAALNMLTSQFAAALPEIRLIAVTPGFTATDLNGHTGTETVAQGVRAVVRAVTGELTVPTGSFADVTGVIPW